jgi:hypothetical protein
MRFFSLNWFGQKNQSELLNNHLKYLRFWLRIRRDIRILCLLLMIRIRKFSFCVLSEYGNFPSPYYQNTKIFLPRIIRIRKFSFRVLSVYVKFHSAYYLLMLSFFLEWKIHSAYSQYDLSFVPCILTIR